MNSNTKTILNITVKAMTYLAVLLAVSVSFAKSAKIENKNNKKSIRNDFQTLGDNKAFAERVKNMDADRKVRIVQNRIVDLNNRFEIGGHYGINGGGDSYVTTQNIGAHIEFHFNPRWSLGVRYMHSYNEISGEGQAQWNRAREEQAAGGNPTFVGIDYPIDTTLATVSYAPIYGKLNLFDAAVSHFDIYLLGGYGQVKLTDSTSNAYTAGMGVGLWHNQWFSTRLEGRYLGYKDLKGTRDQNAVQGMFAIGILI